MKSLFERGMSETEPDPVQSDIREHGLGLHASGDDRTDHESDRRPGNEAKIGRPAMTYPEDRRTSQSLLRPAANPARADRR